MSTLERAITIAAEAHSGKPDKAGQPYILHPLRVMLRLTSTEDRIAGVLHDVVEDSDWSIEMLRSQGFSEDILSAIDAVTIRPGEDYEVFVLRAAKDPIGRRVKFADLEDNSDMGRIASLTDRDLRRMEKYRRAIALIASLPEP